jgi:hypothetical protein
MVIRKSILHAERDRLNNRLNALPAALVLVPLLGFAVQFQAVTIFDSEQTYLPVDCPQNRLRDKLT